MTCLSPPFALRATFPHQGVCYLMRPTGPLVLLGPVELVKGSRCDKLMLTLPDVVPFP